jgi:GNAT superfamily N-acetyltransferase
MAPDGFDRATVSDLATVLREHHRFWGDRDLRALHNPILVHEFGDTALVHRAADGTIDGYLFGFVTPAGDGYVHLVAVRDDARGSGLGRRLYAAFASLAAARGARGLKAITSVANAGSIAFHRALGFSAETVPDYAAPGVPRVVFRRDIHLPAPPPPRFSA